MREGGSSNTDDFVGGPVVEIQRVAPDPVAAREHDIRNLTLLFIWFQGLEYRVSGARDDLESRSREQGGTEAVGRVARDAVIDHQPPGIWGSTLQQGRTL